MRYIVDDEVVVDTSISTDSPKVDVDVITGEQVTCDTELIVAGTSLSTDLIIEETKVEDIAVTTPYGIIKDKGLIYRGIYATEGLAWHFFPQSTEGFTQQGDYYVKQFNYRITDQTKVAYLVNDVRYNYSRYEAKQGGVYFYYANNGNEIFAAQGQMGGNANLNIPVGLGMPESLYFGEEQQTVFDYPMMINGKAPYGSSEDDAVWTVYLNPLDEYGNVVEEEIEVLENQVWSEIKNMYN